MSRVEQESWLALMMAPGLSANKRRELLSLIGDIKALKHITSAVAQALKLKRETLDALTKPNQAALDRCNQWLDEPGRSLLSIASPDYPPMLARVSDAPVALLCEGDTQRLHLPCIAIVGSRGGTAGGLDFATSLAREFSASGLTIVSGLALGIDAAAHSGALKGPGSTAAVMATGVDLVYPKQNQKLARAIVEQGGVLLSEMPLATPPLPALFPQRNRIISGLSLGVVVVEANVQSGSLITARMAGEQGREVFAVPGSVHNPMARGCHALIRQGAKLIESAADVLGELGALLQAAANDRQAPTRRYHTSAAAISPAPADTELAPLEPEDQRILDAMGFDAIAIDQLVERTQHTIPELSSTLLRLELDGYVEALNGARYQRKPGV
jgi:DNA processing protein